MKQSIHTFRRIVGAALALFVVLALPTGWLYDLWAGIGTEQGQRPGEDVQRLRRIAAGGFYNRYYLMELGDNSWLCVYFDDYLTLTGTDAYPTGYVRYTTTEERRMLNRMTEDYDIDSVYVLDMYRHGKVNWMLDLGLRLGMVLVVYMIVVTVPGLWKKQKETKTD